MNFKNPSLNENSTNWNIDNDTNLDLNNWIEQKEAKYLVETRKKLKNLKMILISNTKLTKLRESIWNNQSVQKYNRMTWTDWKKITKLSLEGSLFPSTTWEIIQASSIKPLKRNEDWNLEWDLRAFTPWSFGKSDAVSLVSSYKNKRRWGIWKIIISLSKLLWLRWVIWSTSRRWYLTRTDLRYLEHYGNWIDVRNYWEIKKITWQEFDYDKYLINIAKKESWNKWYSARNDVIWKKKNIKFTKWAFWKYQFTVETLLDFWVDLRNPRKNWISESRVKDFFRNIKLQEELMAKYTNRNLNKALNNRRYITQFKSWNKSVSSALATGHLWWYGWLMKYMKGQYLVDWLWTSTNEYIWWV